MLVNNGLILQYGNASATSTRTSKTMLPITFPTKILAVVGTRHWQEATNSDNIVINVGVINNDSVIFYTSNSGSHGLKYIAIGK